MQSHHKSNIVDDARNGFYDINGSLYSIDEPDLNDVIAVPFSFNRGSTIVYNMNLKVSDDRY